jgi:hypothetical protein
MQYIENNPTRNNWEEENRVVQTQRVERENANVPCTPDPN